MFGFLALIILTHVQSRRYTIDQFPECSSPQPWVQLSPCAPPDSCSKIKGFKGPKVEKKCSKHFGRVVDKDLTLTTDCTHSGKEWKYNPGWYNLGMGWTKKPVYSEGWEVICGPKTEPTKEMYSTTTGKPEGYRLKACDAGNVLSTEACGTGCVHIAQLNKKAEDISNECPKTRKLTASYVCKSSGDWNPTGLGIYGLCSKVGGAHAEYDNEYQYSSVYSNGLDNVYEGRPDQEIGDSNLWYGPLMALVVLDVMTIFMVIGCTAAVVCLIGGFVYCNYVTAEQRKRVQQNNDNESPQYHI